MASKPPLACPQAWFDTWGPPGLAFVVLGTPRGYVAAGSHHWTKRSSHAWTWCVQVRCSLLEQLTKAPPKDVRVVLDEERPGAKLMASKTEALHIGTVAYFVTGNHPDPENIHKLAKDALFYKVKGGDKWTGGIYTTPRYDPECPRTEVFVWPDRDGQGDTIFERETTPRRRR